MVTKLHYLGGLWRIGELVTHSCSFRNKSGLSWKEHTCWLAPSPYSSKGDYTTPLMNPCMSWISQQIFIPQDSGGGVHTPTHSAGSHCNLYYHSPCGSWGSQQTGIKPRSKPWGKWSYSSQQGLGETGVWFTSVSKRCGYLHKLSHYRTSLTCVIRVSTKSHETKEH